MLADPYLAPGTFGLIPHTFPLAEIDAAYDLFKARGDGVVKVAIQGP